MAHIWPCVLLLLSSLLSYGHSEERPKAVLTLEPNRSQIFTGESVTFICDMKEEEKDDWQYAFYHKEHNEDEDGVERVTHHQTHTLTQAVADVGSGQYWCTGVLQADDEIKKKSNKVTLNVSATPKTTLMSDKTSVGLLTSDSVTLTCTVDGSTASWKIYWYRNSLKSEPLKVTEQSTYTFNPSSVIESGRYWCRGGRGKPTYYTDYSSPIYITISGNTDEPVPILSKHPDWPEIYIGETIILRCTIQEGSASAWEYTWLKYDRNIKMYNEKHHEFVISPLEQFPSGDYTCKGRRKHHQQPSAISNTCTLSFKADKPKAILKADQTDIPVGGSVTLTCSVEGSSGWKYYWYQQNTDSVIMQDGPISVSEGGIYWCRGGRGESVYYTDYSDTVTMNRIVGRSVVILLQPSWSHIFSGETITLKCEIQGRAGDTDWSYEWRTTSLSSYTPENQAEIKIVSHSGDYMCKGSLKNDLHSSTGWSDAFKLIVSYKAQPVLSLSPPWLSPGDSMTMRCNVKDSSEGWRFSWYRAVPKPSDNTYTYEPLPGSQNGTVDGTYTIHDPTGTGGYVCNARRGDPVYYTVDSEPQFVWSGDLHSSASLTVSPNRTQHFTRDSVYLRCEGNSTEWSMKRYDKFNTFSRLKMTESTWTKHVLTSAYSGVYWCESGLGEYSNAVNITVRYGSVILVSPVRPVTEGHSVTLHCKHKIDLSLSNVDFYRNEELVQNATNGELIIPAVSKSNEGFYKCKYSGLESPQSWMAVRLSHPAATGPLEQSSLNVVGLIVGLLVVILLTIVLLLLCRYRTSKDPCCVRSVKSRGTNQDAAADQRTNHGGSPDDGHAPLQHGEAAAEPSDVTYSQIELKHMGKKKKEKSADPLESSLYSEVKIGSATGSGEPDVTYAQVNHQNKGKVKNKKAPEATEDTVYSQVKPGTALGE